MTRNLALGFFASFMIGAACSGAGGGTGDTDGGECPVGSEGCPCTGGGVCDPDLECIDDVCTGPDACPVGSAGCPCTGGGACDPNLTCEGDICRAPDGCAVGSAGCTCTGGGACDPGLTCMTDVCVPDDPGGTTGNTTDTTNTTNTTDPTATTGDTTDPTATTTNTTDPTATTGNTTDPTATTGNTTNTTGGSCTAGDKGCECDVGTCNGGLMCLGNVCMTSASALAHWNFQNNPNDVSGNGFNGFEVGTVTYQMGQDGLAAVFNGESHINIASFTDTFNGIQSAFTVAMTIYVDSYKGDLDSHLFGRGSQGENLNSNAYGIWVDQNSIYHLTETGANGNDDLVPIYTPSPTPGAWVDLVFVYQDPFVWYYQNGELFADGVIITSPDTTSPQMWIAGFPAVPDGFMGKIDDVQVFSGALTQ